MGTDEDYLDRLLQSVVNKESELQGTEPAVFEPEPEAVDATAETVPGEDHVVQDIIMPEFEPQLDLEPEPEIMVMGEDPEPEAIALLHRLGYSYAEAGVSFRTRRHGRSSIGSLDAVYFMVKVVIALVADRVRRIDRRDERRHVVRSIETHGRGFA